MKNLILTLISLISVTGYANELPELYVGNSVIIIKNGQKQLSAITAITKNGKYFLETNSRYLYQRDEIKKYTHDEQEIDSGEEVLTIIDNQYVVCEVLQDYGNGKYLLKSSNDEKEYKKSRFAIFKKVTEKNGYITGEEVEDKQNRSVREITTIYENSIVEIAGKVGFTRLEKYSKLLTEFEGIEPGDQVLETYQDFSIRKVLRIYDNNEYGLDDGNRYSSKWVESLMSNEDD
jgi:hypothetical protein